MGHLLVDMLVLGQGWTGAYLVREANKQHLRVAATTRDGRDSTIVFAFDPESSDSSPFRVLPVAQTIVITFPVLSEIAMQRLTSFYLETHAVDSQSVRWILLGTTSNFNAVNPSADPWCDRHTPLSNLTPRNAGESELLNTRANTSTVIHLTGLFDETQRNPRNFIARIAPTKDALKARKSVHYIHGEDVARALVAVHLKWAPDVAGQRWILSNMRVYDWWDFLGGAVPTGWNVEEKGTPEVWKWVLELCKENRVKALPRGVHELERGIDTREFWERFGLLPLHSQL
ncbi:hypothetical protein HDU78_008533 [Chytriomyces hyalinus]|nr:hypothetical protein HDU78_008533 [Chytriomyces hyalinus]